jgi:hypothetical protein
VETAERHRGNGLESIDDIVKKTLRISSEYKVETTEKEEGKEAD